MKQNKEIKPVYEANNHTQGGKKNTFEDHITANPDGTFTCIVETIHGLCNKIIKNYRHAIRHVQTVHEKLKPFQCAVCKRSFGAKQLLMRHNELHHNGKKEMKGKNMCNLCDLNFFDFHRLKDHIWQIHPAEAKEQILLICKNNETSNKQIYDGKKETHIETIETKNQGFPLLSTKVSKKKLSKEENCKTRCNLCSIICLNNRELKNHIKRVHVSGLSEPYLCEPCNMSFMREEQFTKHGRIIHNEKHENVEIQEVTDLTVHENETPHSSDFTS